MTRYVIFFLTTFLALTVAHGQSFKREKNETAEQFVQRITSVGNLAYQIVETKEWDSTKSVLLAFIPTPDEITVGLMFVPIDSFSYRQVLIDSFSTKGNTARIDNVFFFNADSDKEKELIVMTTYDQSQNGQLTKIYWNLIFDNPQLAKIPSKLKSLRQLSKQINGSKFKDQASITTALSFFDKDEPFEIINSKNGITKESSDKDTTKCKGWTIPQTTIPLIIKDSKVISGDEWHDYFGVFRCIISGQLIQNGQTYTFEINAGSWTTISRNGRWIYLGSFKKEYEKYFIDKAWDGN